MKMGVAAKHDGGDYCNMLVKKLADCDVETYDAEVEEREKVKVIGWNGREDFVYQIAV